MERSIHFDLMENLVGHIGIEILFENLLRFFSLLLVTDSATKIHYHMDHVTA